MYPSFAHGNFSFLANRILLIVAMILLSSGWTCSALFVSCQGVGSQSQIKSVSPDSIAGNVDSVMLTVQGSGFARESQIMWNGNALPTTVVDQQHLRTTITQQTLESFGVRPGSSVQISAKSHGNDFS